MRKLAFVALILLFGYSFPSGVQAEPIAEKLEIGIRAMGASVDGESIEDMAGAGVYGRYRWKPRWLIGVAIDVLSAELEGHNDIVRLKSPQEIEAAVDSIAVSGWVEREYGNPDRHLHWFWTAGLGFASPDVDDARGPVMGGGTMNLITDADSEVLVSASGGIRGTVFTRWSYEVGLRVDHHLADWDVRDKVSGQRGSISDYTATGLHGGVTYRF